MKVSKRRSFSVGQTRRENKYFFLIILSLLTGITSAVLVNAIFETPAKELVAQNDKFDSVHPEPVAPAGNGVVSEPAAEVGRQGRRRAAFSILAAAPRPNTGAPRWMTEPSVGNETQEEERPEAPADRLKFRLMQMRDEAGEIPLDGLQKARKQMDRMRARSERRARLSGEPERFEIAGLSPGDWTSLGPGNAGGRIRAIVIDPNNANRMWIGSAGGGIWRTTTAGTSWSPVNDFMANLAVSTMVINPNSPTIMYAGTGESFAAGNPDGLGFTPDGLRGLGVFQSIDGGITWNQLASTNPAAAAVCPAAGPACPWSYVNRLAISPDGGTILASTIAGVWRSIDGGATWTAGAGVAGNAADMDFHPTNSQNAVVGGQGAAAFTIDGGQNWTLATFTPAIGGRVELAYAPSNPQIVYAAVNANNGDVYRSTDGGQTYNRVNTGTNFFLGAGGTGNQGGYDNIIWVNPQDATFVIVGGIDLWRSTNSGANFTQISRWQCGPGQTTACANTSAHADHHMIVAPPGFNNTTNKIVFFGNDGGMFRVDDVSTVGQANGWVNLNNSLGITQFYGGAASINGVLFGGTQDNSTLRADVVANFDPPYDPQGWDVPTNAGGDGGYVATDPTDANYFYGEQQNMALFRSSDGGATVTSINAGITDTANANFVAPFILDPSDPNTMLAGSWNLWRSNDVKAATPTWNVAKTPATPLPPAPGATPNPTPPISAIAVSPSNSDFVVVGHNDGQIFRTFNGTSTTPTWNAINTAALPTRFVTRLAIDNTRSPNWIYATLGGFSGNNVWVTRDLGATWIDISGATGTATDLPAVPVRSILINLANANFLYIGTEVGVFASEDAGATWQLPQGGPANVSVDELFFYRGDLMAATHGRGMYTTRAPVLDLPSCAWNGDAGPPCPSPSARCRLSEFQSICCVPGAWECPCTWNNKQIPTQNDDIFVYCPITVNNNGAVARNLRVDGRLSLNGGSVNVQGDVVNFGLIESVGPFSSNITANNVLNVRPEHAVTLKGIISLNLPWLVRGGIANYGIITGAGFDLNGPIGATQTISGTGEWNSAFVRINRTAQLATDVTLNTASVIIQPFARLNLDNRTLTANGNGFTVSGTMDLGTGTFNFRGNQFQASDPNQGDVNFGIKGTGTVNVNPTSGTADFAVTGSPGSFQPSLRIQSGTINSIFRNTIGGSFVIDPGATFNHNENGMTVNGDVAIRGTLAKNQSFTTSVLNFNGVNFENTGSVFVDFIAFNTTGAPRMQTITGTGPWSGTSFSIGPQSTTTLNNDIAVNHSSFGTANGAVLNLGTFTLTFTGSSFNTSNGGVIGTGTLRMQRTGTAATLNGTGTDPIRTGVTIASGTVTPSTRVSGPFTIDPGATLSGGALHYMGNTFTNNGSVVSTSLSFGSANFQPINQQIGGTGTYSGASGQLFISSPSNATLVSDVTYVGSRIFTEGRLNTGAFTLTLPCPTGSDGPGDILGNVRRTNLTACSGPIGFGNRFNTVQFTSGTPPSEILFNTALTAPVGFPGAAQRTYVITPTGGSGYTATLRLHYLDSELNGNNESSLQLWRNDGSNWTPQGATNRNTTENWVEYSNVTQFSPWTVSQAVPPVASVSVNGRVTTSSGTGIARVAVRMTGMGGSGQTAMTNSFGYFHFEDVATGQSYVFSATNRRHRFTPQTMTVWSNIAGLNFTADEF